jgi:peptide/nickel transport system substrate-binding protein
MSSARSLALCVCLATWACSRAPIGTGQLPKKPTTLTIGWPFLSGQDSFNGIQQAIRVISFEGLTVIGRDGRAEPRLAEGWSESTDGLSWTIQLRRNAVFHDGSVVDSSAVKASLMQTLSSSTRDFSAGLLDIVAIETPQPDQVVITLRARSAFLLDDLTVSITKLSANGERVGTGPYVRTSISTEEVVTNAFPSYYRGTPKIEKVVWKSYPTARTSWAAMMRGEIDFLYEVAPDALEFMHGETSVRDFPFLRNYVHGLVFNSQRPVFRDSRVRRALNFAIDRQAMIGQVFKGRGMPAYTPTWPQHWAYDADLPAYAYDPARAVALLEAAGARSATERQGRRPARLHFTCIFPISPLWERMALIVQRHFAQIGVDVQLEAVELDEFNRRIGTGDFDTVLMDLLVGNATSRPYFFWYSSSRQNAWGYRNGLVDQALDRLRYSDSEGATRSAFRELQSQFLNDPPGVFLAFGEITRAVNRRFMPVVPPAGDVFRTIAEWQPADAVTSQDTN